MKNEFRNNLNQNCIYINKSTDSKSTDSKSTDNNNFITEPDELKFYIKNKFNTNSKNINKTIHQSLDKDFIEKLISLLKIHILKYGDLTLNTKPKSIKNKHMYFLEQAKYEACKSLLNHQHGCVIVYQNKIVATGYNKYAFKYKEFRSIHAEEDALKNLLKIGKFQNKNIRNNCKLYVVRVQKGTNFLKMSRPCKNCIKNINDCNIGITYYSTNDTFIDDLICQFISKNI